MKYSNLTYEDTLEILHDLGIPNPEEIFSFRENGRGRRYKIKIHEQFGPACDRFGEIYEQRYIKPDVPIGSFYIYISGRVECLRR